MMETRAEKKDFSFLKLLGIIGALALIVFGSADNIYRTAKMAWHRLVGD